MVVKTDPAGSVFLIDESFFGAYNRANHNEGGGMTDRKLRRFVKRWLLNRKFQPVQGLSQSVGRWFSNHLTANQVTLIGLVTCIPMTFLYLVDRYFLAGILLTVSLLTDFVDGALAHYQQGTRPPMTLAQERQLSILQRINYRGVTHLGKSLDPLVDKIRFFCVLYALGLGVVHSWLIISLTVVAAALTLIRPIKRWLKMGDGRSNRFGKFKIWAELLAMALLILYPTNRVLLNTTFIFALLFGLLSLAGHLITGYVELRTRRVHKKSARSHQRAVRDKLPVGIDFGPF